MSSLMGLEPCGFLYMSVCVSVVYLSHPRTHRCWHPLCHGRHQLLCASDVHISPAIALFLSRAFPLCLCLFLLTLTHRQMLSPPGVKASSAWYPANSFIGPGAWLSDHYVMWMLISSDMVQFKKGDAVPMFVITLISGYCTVHVYWSNIESYKGLILVHKGYKLRCMLSCGIESMCSVDFYWNVNTASCCCSEMEMTNMVNMLYSCVLCIKPCK